MKKSERIEGYLQGSMSHAEVKDFEEEIARDANLAHEVEVMRFELDVIGQLEADALRAKIKMLRQEKAGESADKPTARKSLQLTVSRFRWWAAAAATIAVLIAALFLLPKTDTPEKLIAEEMSLFPRDYSGNLKAAGDAQGFAPYPIEILEQQDKSRAGDAVRYFQSFTSPDSTLQMRARLNLAHSLLLAGDTEQAIQVFGEIERSTQNDDSIRQAAQYYRALAVLQKKDIAQAHQLLKAIADQPAHLYQPRAARMFLLLEKLR